MTGTMVHCSPLSLFWEAHSELVMATVEGKFYTEVQLLVTLKEASSVSFESNSMLSVSESDTLPW